MKITDPTIESYFVQHVVDVDDYDYTGIAIRHNFRSIDEIVAWSVVEECPYTDRDAEEIEEYASQMRATLEEYSPEEVLEAHAAGYGWPEKLGYVS